MGGKSSESGKSENGRAYTTVHVSSAPERTDISPPARNKLTGSGAVVTAK
jgi:hypothetical protein